MFGFDWQAREQAAQQTAMLELQFHASRVKGEQIDLATIETVFRRLHTTLPVSWSRLYGDLLARTQRGDLSWLEDNNE